MGELPVEVQGLVRRFGARTALRAVDLDVRPGEIVGLVGPNGSGKTTLLRILAGLLGAHDGRARCFGLDPWRDGPAVMRRARFAFAPPALFDALTPREHLLHLASLHGGPPPRAAIHRALATVGLTARADDRVRTFSFGMRQRLALALALVPEPELIVLDEPTDGLDPVGVVELRDLLVRLRERGLAVLLSSHLLGEIERLVDRLLVLHEGRTVFYGRPAELLEGTERLRVEVRDGDAARARLGAAGLQVTSLGPTTIELEPDALTLEGAVELLGANAGGLEAFHRYRPSLEEALFDRLRAAGPSAEEEA